MIRSSRVFVVTTVVSLCLWNVGCRGMRTQGTPDPNRRTLWDQLFPADSDAVFFDERSHSIEQSLNRSSQALERTRIE